MRGQFRVRVSTLLAAVLAVSAVASACSSANSTVDDPNAPFGIVVSQTYITVENRTGSPIIGGQVDIIPAGVLPPFRAPLPRLEAGAKSDLMLTVFRGSGAPFNRSIARAKAVKVSAKDQFGKVYEHEVPFE